MSYDLATQTIRSWILGLFGLPDLSNRKEQTGSGKTGYTQLSGVQRRQAPSRERRTEAIFAATQVALSGFAVVHPRLSVYTAFIC